MRFILVTLSLVATVTAAHAAQLDGHWEGIMARDGATRPIVFDFVRDVAGQKAAGRFSSETEAVLDYPFDSVNVSGSSARLVLGGNKSAAALFLHGSGGEVRWGRSFFYADVLARHGIAALVYDKRGVGASTGDWKASNYDDLENDAIAAIHYLQQRREIAAAHVGLIGHSEGGTLGPLIAARSKDVAFVVSEAGVVGSIRNQDMLRVRHNLEDHGFGPADVEAALASYRQWLEVARAGGVGWERINALVPKVEKRPWYGWVELPPRDSWVWRWYSQVADVDTTSAWEKITIPVLVVYGECDRLEAVDEDLAAIDRSLRRAQNRDYTEIILPAAAHNLTLPARPGEPFEGRVAPGWPELLATWIVAHTVDAAPRSR